MMDPRKDLPPVSAPNFTERLRETVSTYLGNRGDRMDRGLTLRDLVDANIIKLRTGFLSGSGGNPVAGPGSAAADAYEADLSPPPAPDGLAATTSGASIQVTITPQTYRQGHGPAKVLVFGAKYLAGDPLPTYAGAAVLSEFSGDVHAFPVDSGSLYRIWAKSVSVDGVESSVAGGTNGVLPVTGLLDDVSIASLTAAKIKSGSITVGQFIQSANYVALTSGWRINGDGTAELANAIVRGGVYASYGLIGGNTIDATGIQSPGYVSGISGWRLNSSSGLIEASNIKVRGEINGGSFTGNFFPPTGTGFHLGPTGLLFGNTNTQQYLQVTAAGVISRANVIATGTWTGSIDGLVGGGVTVDTGYDDVQSIANVNSPTFTANGVATTGFTTFTGGGPGAAKHCDVDCEAETQRSQAFYTIGAVGPALGRVLIRLTIAPVRNVHPTITAFSVTQIQWALLRAN